MTVKKPNVVLLMCDQFRADCLSIADHPDVRTPYLDSIGGDGTYFDNAYSATPSCIPARTAIFTGRSRVSRPGWPPRRPGSAPPGPAGRCRW